mgnify:FL=1
MENACATASGPVEQISGTDRWNKFLEALVEQGFLEQFSRRRFWNKFFNEDLRKNEHLFHVVSNLFHQKFVPVVTENDARKFVPR